jgi:hypothetical protein
VHDTTVSNETRERESRAIVIRNLSFQVARYARDDDESLARVLITSWALHTGRTLRADVPPKLVSAAELISFWADDQMAASAASVTSAATATRAGTP